MNKLQVLPLAIASLSVINPIHAQEEEEVFQLSPFVVQSTSGDSYREDQSTTGTIVAMAIKDIPMDMTVIGANLMEDLGLYNMDDLDGIIPSLTSTDTPGSDGGGGATRYLMRGFRSVPLRNGAAPGGRIYDSTGVDRVEVVKGPNSVLYGQTDPGGIINFVPKRPLIQNSASFGVSAGDYGFFRAEADINGYIGDSKRFGYRVPVSFHTEESDIDYFEKERFVIAPSVLFRIGNKTELFIETEYIDQEINLADDRAWVRKDANGDEFIDYNKGGLGRSFSSSGPNTYSTNEQLSGSIELTSEITDNLHVRALYHINDRDFYQRKLFIGNTKFDYNAITGKPYEAIIEDSGNNVYGGKVDVLYEREIFGIDTRTLFGYERNENEFWVDSQYRTQKTNKQPALPDVLAGEPISAADYEWVVGTPETNPDGWKFRKKLTATNKWNNYRLNQTLYLLDNRVIALLGVARGDITNYSNGEQSDPTERETIYMAGVTYKATDNIALFANNSTSFSPAWRVGRDDKPLAPISGEGIELGTKVSLIEDSLFATLTYFQLINEGIPSLVDDPDGNYYVSGGEEEATGVELELNWKINPQWEIYASAIQFDGELVSPAGAGSPGQDLPKTPEKAAQMTVTYKFAKDSSLNGLRVGLSGTYTEGAPTDGSYGNPDLRSDDYALLNGFVSYILPINRRIAVSVNVRNLFDESYLKSNLRYGSRRSVSAKLTYKF
jgi:iron complex outermembrane receptor protein